MERGASALLFDCKMKKIERKFHIYLYMWDFFCNFAAQNCVHLMKKERNIEIDIMKGFAILCVMIGHAAWCPDFVDVFINSFHMPLFFIISGYFAKTSEESTVTTRELIYKNFKQLILPYIIVACVSCTYILMRALYYHDMSMFSHAVVRYSLAMDTKWDNTLLDDCWVGPMWFVLALFWGRLFFYQLSRTGKCFLPLCIGLSIAMILLHPYIPTPWGIGRGIMALAFLAIGYLYRKYKFPLWAKIVAILCWILSMYIGTINVSAIQFNCLPIDMIGACGGTLIIYYLSKGIARTFIQPFFSWCGRNSLVILCAHSIEMSMTIVHVMVSKLSFRIPSVAYYGFKHGITLAGAWGYERIKMKTQYEYTIKI